MKLSHHFCDFCGNEIKRGDKFATMRVPHLDEPHRVDPTTLPQAKSQTAAQRYSDIGELFTISLGGIFTSHGETQSTGYDICLGCVRSFLVARFSALKTARALMRGHANEVAVSFAGVCDDEEDE